MRTKDTVQADDKEDGSRRHASVKKNWKAQLHFVQLDVELVLVWDASVRASNATDCAIAPSVLDLQDIVHRW